MGMLEAVGEVFPDAKYQRCVVHFYRNVFSVVPKSKAKIVAKMLKAIHAQENKKASREKAKAVVAELRAMKLKEAAKKVGDGIEETLAAIFPGLEQDKSTVNKANSTEPTKITGEVLMVVMPTSNWVERKTTGTRTAPMP